MATRTTPQCVCVLLVLAFPAIAMWFPHWLQARRLAERNAQIEYVAPPPSATAAFKDLPGVVRNF